MDKITKLIKSPSNENNTNSSFLQFDDNLQCDKSLQLSESSLVDAFKSRLKFEKKPKLERIKSLELFPETHVFAQLSCQIYLDPEQLMKKESLPIGWELISTATNTDISNGYFGAVFLQPEHHRVVVAHRGTLVTNVGSVITDLTGIVFNNSVGQLESACTFVEKVAEGMREIEKIYENEIHFELYITGHSLGAFLTQVTAFSNEFLEISDNQFIRRLDNDKKIYHAQTFAFDSPGVKPMLKKLKKQYETDDHPIDLESLHLLSYLSAPNQVNTCNNHFGKVYRTFIDTSNMTVMDRNVAYTIKTHSMDAIVESFKNGDSIEEVLLWPVRGGLADFQELDKFLKYADYRNRYHIGQKLWDKLKTLGIKYRTQVVELASCPLNTFDRYERHLLEFIHWFSNTPERHLTLHEIFKIFKDNQVIPEVERELLNFKINQENVVFDNVETKRKFIPLVKSLLKTFPKISMKLQELLSDNEIRGKIFQLETQYFLSSNNIIEYKPSVLDVNEIFRKHFVQVKVLKGNVRSLLSVLFKNFETSELRRQYKSSGILAFDLPRFLVVNEMIDMKVFLDNNREKFLVVIIFEESQKFDKRTKKAISEFFKIIKSNSNVNVVAIGSAENDAFEVFGAEAKTILDEKFTTIEKSLNWCDIEDKSKEKVLATKMNFQGYLEEFSNLLPPHDFITCDYDVVNKLLQSEEIKLNTNPLFASNCSVFTTVYDKKEINVKILMENLEFGNEIFYISGIYNENFDYNLVALKELLKAQKDKENLILENLSVDAESFGKCSKKLHLNTLPGNENSVADFDSKCRIVRERNANLHWLKVKDDKFTLRQSFQVGKYIDRTLLINEANINFKNLLLQDKNLLVITGPTGEGKSAFLTGLAQSLLTTHWIFFLNCYDMQFPSGKSTEFHLETFKSILKRDDDVMLFNFALKCNLMKDARRPILIFLDAFEKVQNDRKRGQILKMISFIQQSTPCKVIMSSNNDSLKFLNDLKPTLLKFKKLTREEREKIIREEWRSFFLLVWGYKKTCENLDGDKCKFKSYVTVLLDLLDREIDVKSENLMGAAKQLRLLAEGFREDFEKFVNMNRLTRMIFESFAFKIFYKSYVKTKYDLYISTLAKKDELDQKGKDLVQSLIDVPQDVKSLMDGKSDIISSDYLWLQLTKDKNSAQNINTLVGFILTDSKCAQVRTFLNGRVDYMPSVSTIEISNEISTAILGKPFITVAKEGHVNILNYLVEILKTNKDLKDVQLGKDENNKTAIDYTIEKKRADCLRTLLKFLIDFGNFNASKEALEKIGIEKVKNTFPTDENIQTLMEAFSDE